MEKISTSSQLHVLHTPQDWINVLACEVASNDVELAIITNYAVPIAQMLLDAAKNDSLPVCCYRMDTAGDDETYPEIAEFGLTEAEFVIALRRSKMLAVWAVCRLAVLQSTFTKHNDYETIWHALQLTMPELKSLWKHWRYADIGHVMANANTIAQTARSC